MGTRHTAFGRFTSTTAPRSVMLIRLVVGAVFFEEGIQKFLFADMMGAGRFARIGIPVPEVMGPLVGTVEIVCGALILLGWLTRLAAIPLLINISVIRGTMLMGKDETAGMARSRAVAHGVARCVARLCRLLAALLWCCPLAALAGPPFVTDDPEPVERGHWEFYVASQHAKTAEGWSGAIALLELNYGRPMPPTD